MGAPFAYMQHRREPVRQPELTVAERNVRPVENIFPHEAPDPIRQGDTPSRPARMPVVVFLAIQQILSVMQDDFSFDLWAPDHLAAVPPGAQHPWDERSNIRRPSTMAYGSLFTLDPPPQYGVDF